MPPGLLSMGRVMARPPKSAGAPAPRRPPAVVEASAADFANNGNDFRAVTCDYAAEGSLRMSVKIRDMVVIGSATDYEGYIFALDTFKDKSGYIPVSALSA